MSKNNLYRRIKLYQAQSGKCHYCGKFMFKPAYKSWSEALRDRDCTIEHLKSVHENYGVRDRDIVAACFKCNQNRSEKFLRENKAYCVLIEVAVQTDKVNRLMHREHFLSKKSNREHIEFLKHSKKLADRVKFRVRAVRNSCNSLKKIS